MDVKCEDGLTFMKSIDNESIDLILTDPPYIISRESGMNTLFKKIKQIGRDNLKTESDWEIYKAKKEIQETPLASNFLFEESSIQKHNYLKYGSIYGKKYSVKTDYGDWDKDFTMEILEEFIEQFYLKLKTGGTIIIFFDIWKISYLRDLLEKYKFKQIRFIEWIKTNPQPLNSKTNYLTNCREIALVAVKGSKPTFNSLYDKGIYEFPIQSGKKRFHPTQKSIKLFEALITKHSNENDIVMDTFLGGGTTAIACKNTKRRFKGCEILEEYFDLLDLV